MNPDEVKEVQQLQELLTKFNADSSFITAQSVQITETGEDPAKVGKLTVGDDGETMFFIQAK